MRPWRRRRFARFGEHSMIHRPRWLYGEQKIEIGSGVMCFQGAWISAERDGWSRPGPQLIIGDGVVMRTRASISATTRIVIEDNVLLAGNVSIIDSDHTVAGADEPSVNPLWRPSVSAPIRIGEGTWIAEHCTILRGADVGRRCIIGANSVVTGQIPDHSIAVGSPARVVGSTLDSG